eukprot:scaffold135628_cov20-Prasinocladus_malaysianus.AAC.1
MAALFRRQLTLILLNFCSKVRKRRSALYSPSMGSGRHPMHQRHTELFGSLEVIPVIVDCDRWWW